MIGHNTTMRNEGICTMAETQSDVAVVTGANSGIGRAVALHLAAQGLSVYGTVRSIERATKLQGMATEAGVEVNLVELDVADNAAVAAGLARVLDEATRVDVLVNNAGVGGNGVVEEVTIESFAEVMNVNLYGALRCLKAVLPGMRGVAAARSSTSPPLPDASARSRRRPTSPRSGPSKG